MSKREWEFGDWANIQNHRYRFFFANDELGFFLGQYQSTRYWKVDDAEFLPDCTGWDWQPPKPIEPQYRPFANAAELLPHRERWLVFSAADGSPSPTRISTYNDVCVWTGSSQVGYKYDEAFKELKFEDGTPFGVKLDDDANHCPLNRDKCKDGCFYPYECAKPSGSGSK